jgi:hypothetical protein
MGSLLLCKLAQTVSLNCAPKANRAVILLQATGSYERTGRSGSSCIA